MTSLDGVHTLTIKRAKKRDVGVYKCKVSNDIGWVSCDAQFTVQGKSFIIIHIFIANIDWFAIAEMEKGRALHVNDFYVKLRSRCCFFFNN